MEKCKLIKSVGVSRKISHMFNFLEHFKNYPTPENVRKLREDCVDLERKFEEYEKSQLEHNLPVSGKVRCNKDEVLKAAEEAIQTRTRPLLMYRGPKKRNLVL